MKLDYNTNEKGPAAIKARLAVAALEHTCDAVIFVNGKKYDIDSAKILQGKDLYDAKLTAKDGTEIRVQMEKKKEEGRTKIVVRLKV